MSHHAMPFHCVFQILRVFFFTFLHFCVSVYMEIVVVQHFSTNNFISLSHAMLLFSTSFTANVILIFYTHTHEKKVERMKKVTNFLSMPSNDDSIWWTKKGQLKICFPLNAVVFCGSLCYVSIKAIKSNCWSNDSTIYESNTCQTWRLEFSQHLFLNSEPLNGKSNQQMNGSERKKLNLAIGNESFIVTNSHFQYNICSFTICFISPNRYFVLIFSYSKRADHVSTSSFCFSFSKVLWTVWNSTLKSKRKEINEKRAAPATATNI